jgi:hypothetical protein
VGIDVVAAEHDLKRARPASETLQPLREA